MVLRCIENRIFCKRFCIKITLSKFSFKGMLLHNLHAVLSPLVGLDEKTPAGSTVELFFLILSILKIPLFTFRMWNNYLGV